MQILQLLVYGIVYGSIISLGAIGVSLTYGVVRFANFAHGDLMTLGAYLTLTCFSLLHLPWFVSVLAAIVLTALFTVLLDQLLYKRLRKSPPAILLVSSFGAAIILRSAIQLAWGPNTHVYESGIQLPIRFLGLRIKPDQIYILITSLVLVVLLHLLLTTTKMGKAMRAMADRVELARITGIDTERVTVWTWCIGGALAAVAGLLYGLDTRLEPLMGWHLLLVVFAAAVLGGIGKPYGGILGGMIIGISEELSTLVIPPSYSSAISFSLLVIMLIFRPKGILGGR